MKVLYYDLVGSKKEDKTRVECVTTQRVCGPATKARKDIKKRYIQNYF